MKSASQNDEMINLEKLSASQLINIWKWFTEPASSIRQPELRRRAQLLSALLITMFMFGFFDICFMLFFNYFPIDLKVALGSTLVVGVAYGVSRTSYYKLSVLLTVFALSGSVVALEMFDPQPSPLYFLVLSVLVSSLFLSRRYTAVVMLLNILIVWLPSSLLYAALLLQDRVSITLALLFVGVLGIVSITIRKQDLAQIQAQDRLLLDDIAKREEIEISLRANEKRFRALIENSMEEVSLVSADGTLLYESPSKRRPLGYPPNTFLGHNLLELFHPDDKADVKKLLAEIVTQPGNSQEAMFRVLHGDGSWHWLEGFVTNLLDEPAVHAIVVNYRDVTQRQQAEEEIKRRLADFEAVNQLSGAMRAAHSLEDLLPIVLDHTLEILHRPTGSLWLYDKAKDELQPVVVRGNLQRGDVLSIPPEKPGEGIAGYVFVNKQPYIETNLRESPRLPAALRSQMAAGRGVVAVPIRAADKVIGVLAISTSAPQEMSANDIHLMNTLSEIAGNAIQRTMFREQTERRLQNLTALSEIDKAISASFDLNISLGTLLTHVVGQLGIDAADILLFDANSLVLDMVAEHGFQSKNSKRPKPRLDKSFAGRAIMEHEIVKIDNIAEQKDDQLLGALAVSEKFVSYYAVPLTAKGTSKGVLQVFKRAALEPDEEWLELLNTLAQQAAIAIDNASLFEGVQRSNAELSMAYDATIEGWSHALDLRDKETEGHTLRVTAMTLELARAFGLTDDELAQVRWGALLHDIGKMGIPDMILHKPGSLTDYEWTIMKKHPSFAYDMLSPIHYLQSALDIPYCHHEKWDGSGYPRGLKGQEIPLPARIFAIVDVWDAITSNRPYRPAWPKEKAIEYVKLLSGKHFDPRVVEMFLKIVN